MKSTKTTQEMNRQVAKMAARSVLLYAAQDVSLPIGERLLMEARATDRFSCTEIEMQKMALAEYRKLEGCRKGGHISAAKKQ